MYPLQIALTSVKGLGLRPSTPKVDYDEVVEELLKAGANPNSPLSDFSPLVCCDGATTFDLLVKFGANPNKLVQGFPAYWAIFNSNFNSMLAI